MSQQADTEQSQWPVILLADGLISATKAKMTILKTLVWLDGGDTQKAALILLYHSWRFSTHTSAGTNQTWRSNFNDTPRLTKTLLPRGVYAIKSAHDQSLKETFYWLLLEYCITTITTVISALSLCGSMQHVTQSHFKTRLPTGINVWKILLSVMRQSQL